jgi:hypothetical protein
MMAELSVAEIYLDQDEGSDRIEPQSPTEDQVQLRPVERPGRIVTPLLVLLVPITAIALLAWPFLLLGALVS